MEEKPFLKRGNSGGFEEDYMPFLFLQVFEG